MDPCAEAAPPWKWISNSKLFSCSLRLLSLSCLSSCLRKNIVGLAYCFTKTMAQFTPVDSPDKTAKLATKEEHVAKGQAKEEEGKSAMESLGGTHLKTSKSCLSSPYWLHMLWLCALVRTIHWNSMQIDFDLFIYETFCLQSLG